LLHTHVTNNNRLPRGHIIYPTGVATGIVLGMVGLARDPVACIQMRKQSGIIGVTSATLRGCGKGALGLGMRPLYGGLMTFVTVSYVTVQCLFMSAHVFIRCLL
jgi:hypothetical protein